MRKAAEIMRNDGTRITPLVLIGIGLIATFFLAESIMLTRSPNILIDEPWYASAGYSFLEEGSQDTLMSQTGWASLYPVVLAGGFGVMGTSLLAGRLVSLFAGALGLAGMVWLLSLLRVRYWVVALAGVAYTAANVTFMVFRTVRPEAFLIALTLWALAFLVRGMSSERLGWFFVAGLVAAVSFLCYPPGAIYMALIGLAVVGIAVRRRSLYLPVLYGLGCLGPLLCLIAYVYIVNGMTPWEYFGGWLGRTAVSGGAVGGGGGGFLGTLFDNMGTFFRHYIFGVKRLYIALFEVGILVGGLALWKRLPRVAVLSGLALSFMGLGFLFLNPFTTRMFGGSMVVSVAVYAAILSHAWCSPGRIRWAVLLAGVLYGLNNFAGSAYVLYRDRANTSYGEVTAHLEGVVPAGATVATQFWYWFPLRDCDCYLAYTRWENSPYQNARELVASGDIEYVVISPYGVTDKPISTTGKPTPVNAAFRKRRRFHRMVRDHARAHGERVKAVHTVPYGLIEVWRITNAVSQAGEPT